MQYREKKKLDIDRFIEYRMRGTNIFHRRSINNRSNMQRDDAENFPTLMSYNNSD